jgi:hypothetical protein
MATAGLPSGGQYPARDELRAYLGDFIDEVQQVGANKGYKKFDALSTYYTDSSDNPQEWSGLYYNPSAQTAPANPMGGGNEAVSLTDIPTSSINPGRPRTVAAGYDPKTKTMTVVFRDGTFYNYYDVTPGEWLNFSASYSKGKPWLNKGFPNGKQKFDGLFIGKPHGPADVGAIDPIVREMLYRVARSQQIFKKPRPARTGTYTDKYGTKQRRVSGWQKKTGGQFKRRTGYGTPPTQSSHKRTGL